MRNLFAESLEKSTKKNKNIFLLTGDLGFSVLDNYQRNFPDNFINVGVAEQNMMGVAAGLAMMGKKVFTYSIANFATSRCHEQIRNDICYHNLDVTIVAVGGGLPYGNLGYTHHGMEDIAITRVLPNMTVYIPADRHELKFCYEKLLKEKTPKYLRLARGGEPNIHNEKIKSSKNYIEINKSSKINILTSGTILIEVKNALKKINKNNIGLISMPIVNDKVKQEIRKVLIKSELIFTFEEHSPNGGLGSFIKEITSELSNPPRVISSGINKETIYKVGTQEYLRRANKIDSKNIYKKILNYLNI